MTDHFQEQRAGERYRAAVERAREQVAARAAPTKTDEQPTRRKPPINEMPAIPLSADDIAAEVRRLDQVIAKLGDQQAKCEARLKVLERTHQQQSETAGALAMREPGATGLVTLSAVCARSDRDIKAASYELDEIMRKRASLQQRRFDLVRGLA